MGLYRSSKRILRYNNIFTERVLNMKYTMTFTQTKLRRVSIF